MTRSLKRILQGAAVGYGCAGLALVFYLAARLYPEQNRACVIEIYHALDPGMSTVAVEGVYRSKRSLFMNWLVRDSNRWILDDELAGVVSENWMLDLEFTDNTLTVVRLRSCSPDNKTPQRLFPEKKQQVRPRQGHSSKARRQQT